MTASKYAPVVETIGRKKRKNKVEPPSVCNRFPGGGFAARMKKLMEKREQSNGGRCYRRKKLLKVSSPAPMKKGVSRKKGGARESLTAKCVNNESKRNK